MPWFNARMEVTYSETWAVEAKDADEARKLFEQCADSVQTEDGGGEVTDWQVLKVEADKNG